MIQAAARREAKTDRRSFTQKRVKEKIKNQREKAAQRSQAAKDAAALAVVTAAAEAAAKAPPKQLLNKLDLTSTAAAPSRAILALELEERGLGGKVKRGGAGTAKAGEVTSSKNDLISALIGYHSGESIVKKLTSFEGTKKGRSYDGDGNSRAYKRQARFNAPPPAAAA